MAARRQSRPLDAGSRAPDFRLEVLHGGEVTLREIAANGPVLLAFFKVTCPVCQLTFPFLERIFTAGTLPVYGISQNEAPDTEEFNRTFGVTFHTLLDTEERGFPASNAYGISSVPTLFLVGRDGIISQVIEGWVRSDIAGLGAQAGVSPFLQGDNVPEWKAG
jgi:peroxiredoxin